MSTSYRTFPLAIKVSTRIRISEEERQNLITTYNQQLEEGDLLNHKLGLNNSTFLELVKGRDSVSIPFMLKIQNALRKIGQVKDETTMELVACQAQDLKEHFESLFTDDMSWDNQGEWHVDHIRPCASFDLNDKDQWMVCFNWRNLQPLWQSENTRKQDNYTPLNETEWVERMISLGYEGELFLKYEEGNSY